MKAILRSALKQMSLAVSSLFLIAMGASSCNSVGPDTDSTKFKYALNSGFPRFEFLSVDALGKSNLDLMKDLKNVVDYIAF